MQQERDRLPLSDADLISVSSPPFRPDTKLPRTKFTYALCGGGIGDYIHWIAGLRYAIKINKHLEGVIVCFPFFEDLARLWLSDLAPRFTLYVTKDLWKDLESIGYPACVPDGKQFANATGFHLTRLGFIYYTQKGDYPKDERTLPIIRGDETDLSKFNLPVNYAVITTEATADNRRFPARYVNALTFYLIQRGITPVFLGKKDLAPDYQSEASEGLQMTGIMDLREKTTLVEAACILAGGMAVMGLDNGLLHLAACSRVPVGFIFTNVAPELRIPYRQKGTTTAAISPPEDLTCRHCCSRMPTLPGHDYKRCLYGDNFCVTSFKEDDLIAVLQRLIEQGD